MARWVIRREVSGWWLVFIGAVIVLGAFVLVSKPHAPTNSGSVTGRLTVIPRTNAVKVSPSSVTFGGCKGGGTYTGSLPAELGYPNGQCYIGDQATKSFPITITNTGEAADITVYGSSAISSDNVTPWKLCLPSPPTAATARCNDTNGAPGWNQYRMVNFAAGGKNPTGLTMGYPGLCDPEFGTAGSSFAKIGASQKEGIELIGPYRISDPSPSWTVTITWTSQPKCP